MFLTMKHFSTFFAICTLVFSLTNALYEDQVGKFDWRLENIGEVQHAAFVFDSSQKAKQILISSKENVVASVSATTGKLVWRHVLEETEQVVDVVEAGSSLLTVSTNHVRKWHTQGGYLLWEIAHPGPSLRGRYTVSGNVFIVVSPTKVSAHALKTGSETWSLDAPWTGFDKVYVGAQDDSVYITTRSANQLTVYIVRDEVIKQVATLTLDSTKYCCSGSKGVWLVCFDKERGEVRFADVSQSNPVMSSLSLQPEPVGKTTVKVVGENGMIVQSEDSGTYYRLSRAKATEILAFKGTATMTESSAAQELLMTLSIQHSKPKEDSLMMQVYSTEDGIEIQSYRSTVSTSISARPVKLIPYMYTSVGGTQSYRVLVIFSDHSLALLQQSGRVLWVREEALASISCMEMVDLPVSEVEAQMEEEFGAHNNVISQFFGRLLTQFQQLSSFLVHTYHKHVTGLRVVMETGDHMAIDEDYLTRDEFNLHKMVIAVSSVGKIFGLDSYTGKAVWSRYVSELRPFISGNRLLLYIQRTTAHVPHEPYATVIGRGSCEACGSVIYSFNPITGTPYTTQPIQLNYKIDQAMLLSQAQHDFLKPIVLLDTVKQVHVYPADSQIDTPLELFLFSAQPSSGEIVGLRLHGDNVQSLVAQPTWSVALGSSIVALETKLSREHVHSLGRVQADRAVLYKYVNPNLVAIVTESEASTDHVSLTVYLLDAVSGRVVFTCVHKRASGPVHMVHSENWAVYTYYNHKARRTEIAVLELYEGLTQSNATAFSSLESNTSPIVMRQAYILGTSLSALSTTLTERGITGKNILMARTVGGIVEVPKAFIDPRRPLEPTQASREEGLLPYMPELPLSFDSTVNYNQTVFRIKKIHSEPSGLESTSLIVAYGLDVFHTRIAPSKMYDVLKDDFDYLFIGAVTVGMIVISFVTRHFALRKQMKRAWK